VPQSYYFCIKYALKLTYDHLYFKKKLFRLAITRHAGNTGGKGREGKEGKGREGKRREGWWRRRGRPEREKGKVKGLQPPKFGTLSTPLAVLLQLKFCSEHEFGFVHISFALHLIILMSKRHVAIV
jgi:hypothetical protein